MKFRTLLWESKRFLLHFLVCVSSLLKETNIYEKFIKKTKKEGNHIYIYIWGFRLIPFIGLIYITSLYLICFLSTNTEINIVLVVVFKKMVATGSLFPSASTLYLRVFGLLLLVFPILLASSSSSSVLDKILRIHHHVPTNWTRQETSFSS
jgi:dimeric dUTPase (all-alpha-NTP-PPase superfamily)